jgi:hypothetical protein
MVGIKYEVEISNSILDFSHGFTRRIKEIFVPAEKIIFNLANNNLNVFSSSKARCPEKIGLSKIKLDDDFVARIKEILSLRKICLKKAKKYF